MTITIATSCWFTPLPPGHVKVGISRGTPRGVSGYRRYAKLNPGPWFSSVSAIEYKQRYYAEVLDRLDPATVVKRLTEIADGKIPTLLCWEPPAPDKEWCHRGFISLWLFDKLGLEVYEYGQEEFGCGPYHPKIPTEFRLRRASSHPR